MDLTVRPGRQHVVVSVDGEIIPRTAPTLRECLLRVLNTAPPHVVLDISRVVRMDPAALAVIAEAQRGACLLGGWLCLVSPEPAADLVDQGVSPLIPRYGSVEQALAAQPRAAGGRPRHFGAGTGRRTSA